MIKQIDIKGENWKIEIVKNLEHEGVACDGLCCSETKTIFLDKSLKGKKRMETLAHEFFHAALSEAHVDISYEMEEIIVANLASCLIKTFSLKLR